MKKGQAALEYLLTYGWAILIVIIVGASLYSLGIFSPGQWTGRRQTGFVQFRPSDFKLDTDGDLIIVFRNQLGKTVEITDIVATYREKECDFEVVFSGEVYISTTDVSNVAPGVQYWTILNCTSSLDLGTSYTIDVNIHYIDSESGLSHIDSGTFFGSVEVPDEDKD